MAKASFQALLEKHRKKQKFSKVDVAKAIGKTDGYIRKLENYGYTPPTYTICNQLSDILKLTKKERLIFLKQAFLERIKNEHSFYNEITPYKEPPTPSHNIPELQSLANHTFTFCITLTTYNENTIIDPKIHSTLNDNIIDILEKVTIQYTTIHITPTTIQMLISPPKTLHIHDFITGMKSLIEGIISTKTSPANIPLTNIFEKDYSIRTIGNMPQFENSSHCLMDQKKVTSNNRCQ